MNNTNSVKNDNVKKLDAEKLKKQKAREAAKAKKVKLLEKRKAKIAANKAKRAAKKAKRLAKLEKIRAKKAALREKKRLAKQKKLERLAKQKAKAKELKLKVKEKAKLAKQKEADKVLIAKKRKDTGNVQAPAKTTDTIDITIKLIKDYLKQLAKDTGLDEKKIKKLEKLGFVFNDDTIGFTLEAKRKLKKRVVAPKPVDDIVQPEIVEPNASLVENESIDDVIDKTIGEDSAAIEALAENIEEDASTEVPVGDTFADDVDVSGIDDQPNSFEDDEDDTIDDPRNEDDDDKVDFRRDWNNEFGDDGERNDDY